MISGIPIAVVKLFTSAHSAQHHLQLTFDSLDSRIFLVENSGVFKLVPVECIKEKCTFMDLHNLYIVRFATTVTMD